MYVCKTNNMAAANEKTKYNSSRMIVFKQSPRNDLSNGSLIISLSAEYYKLIKLVFKQHISGKI